MAETTHKSIFGIVAAIVVVVLGYFVYDRTRNPCESIFEDTATNIKADVAFIKTRGAVIIGKEKLRELDEKSNQLGLTLKACCIAAPTEFLKCKEEGSQQEARLAQIKTFVEEAQTAQTQGRTEVVQQKSAEANRAVEEVNSKTEGFVQRVAQLQAAAPLAKDGQSAVGGSEKEPNSAPFPDQANRLAVNAALSGDISPEKDEDWFVFTADTTVRDWLDIKIESRLLEIRPTLSVLDSDRNPIAGKTASAAGANLEEAIVLDPGKDYYVGVTAHYTGSAGPYALTLKLRKAHDAYEPNEEPKAKTLKPIPVGKTIDANIMDEADRDWYEVKGFAAKEMIVRLENPSNTLRPVVAVKDSNGNDLDGRTATNSGANVEMVLPVTAGKDYLVGVSPHYTGPSGSYRLTVTEGQK